MIRLLNATVEVPGIFLSILLFVTEETGSFIYVLVRKTTGIEVRRARL